MEVVLIHQSILWKFLCECYAFAFATSVAIIVGQRYAESECCSVFNGKTVKMVRWCLE
ncbi:hypothetical protein T02_13000 [Trichinella nativa]|uniref:Uncharacterized protein n=1 Tax=Trichinella nativa TaxID=6335 RepID=A0A0V1KJ43_9BILA|nr:hypothetical protein T02_13000 [Trichinella nativa]